MYGDQWSDFEIDWAGIVLRWEQNIRNGIYLTKRDAMHDHYRVGLQWPWEKVAKRINELWSTTHSGVVCVGTNVTL